MMAHVMVDSNVLLDVLTEDPAWFGWSSDTLERHAEDHVLVINPIIYAEVSVASSASRTWTTPSRRICLCGKRCPSRRPF